jgi:hypothetical protein
MSGTSIAQEERNENITVPDKNTNMNQYVFFYGYFFHLSRNTK